MEKLITICCYILITGISILNTNAQELFDTKDSVLKNKDIIGCGHLLDGPSSYLKKIENRSLDTMLELTEDQKKRIGKNNYEQVVKNNTILVEYENKENIIQTFENIKSKVNSEIGYNLHIIDSHNINAFTMLGGHIYLTTGLLSYVESLDELAFIMGHEIGHNEAYHLERKIKKIMITSTYFGATGIDEFTKIAIDLNHKFSAPFDQIDEYEADKYGFEISKKAGYDVNKFADFFKRMEKNEKTSILQKLNATHPFSRDRRKCLESYNNQ